MTFRSGPNGETYHFYDQPAYDAFWRLVVKLDIPICLHTGPYLQTLFLTTLAEEKILL
jgi:2,3-dihydroxybenzoate decarboxylase